MTKRVVVTGAAGFVGSVVSRRLVDDGHDVRLWLRADTDPWRLSHVDAQRRHVDLNDVEPTRAALEHERPDWVFHLAAHGAYPAQTDWRRMFETNVIATGNLIKTAARVGVDAFVNTGSSSEYGFVDHPPGEHELAEPNSDYAASKLSQTQYCRRLARELELHAPTLRLYSVYGPYEEPSRLVPTLVRHGLRGRLPPLTSPDIARDFVYVDDVAEAFVIAATRPTAERGAIYNVGTGRQTTLAEAVDVTRRVLDLDIEPEWGSMKPRKWDTSTWVGNPRKIATELGWNAAVSFEQGLSSFAEWVRSEGHALGRYT